jgi:hypothetical protein
VQTPDPGEASPDSGLHHPLRPGDGPTGEPRRRDRRGHARPCPCESGAGGHVATVLAAAWDPGGPLGWRRGGEQRRGGERWLRFGSHGSPTRGDARLGMGVFLSGVRLLSGRVVAQLRDAASIIDNYI